jgi:hypothetical protein
VTFGLMALHQAISGSRQFPFTINFEQLEKRDAMGRCGWWRDAAAGPTRQSRRHSRVKPAAAWFKKPVAQGVQ